MHLNNFSNCHSETRPFIHIFVVNEKFFISKFQCNDLHERCINVTSINAEMLSRTTHPSNPINKLYKINGYWWFGWLFRSNIWNSVRNIAKSSNGLYFAFGQTIRFINIQISILLHFFLSFIDFSTLFRLTWLEYWTKNPSEFRFVCVCVCSCAVVLNHGGAVQF